MVFLQNEQDGGYRAVERGQTFLDTDRMKMALALQERSDYYNYKKYQTVLNSCVFFLSLARTKDQHRNTLNDNNFEICLTLVTFQMLFHKRFVGKLQVAFHALQWILTSMLPYVNVQIQLRSEAFGTIFFTTGIIFGMCKLSRKQCFEN